MQKTRKRTKLRKIQTQRTGQDNRIRSDRPGEYTAEAKAAISSSHLLKSLVLKNRKPLEVDRFSYNQLIDVEDQEGVLRKLARIAPKIEAKGDSLPEVLNNALIDFYETKRIEWKEDLLEMKINKRSRTWRSNKEYTHIDFFIQYPQTDGMLAFSLDELIVIERKYPKLMPYIYLIITHLIDVNHVPYPDYNRGEESIVKDHTQDIYYEDEESAAEILKEINKDEIAFKKIYKKIRNKKASLKKYQKLFIDSDTPGTIMSLIATGSQILQNNENFWDYCNAIDDMNCPVDPSKMYRFYYRMDNNNYVYNFLSEMVGNDYNESGSIGFIKKIRHDFKGKPSGPNDLPFLIHNYLDKLWDLLNQIKQNR